MNNDYDNDNSNNETKPPVQDSKIKSMAKDKAASKIGSVIGGVLGGPAGAAAGAKAGKSFKKLKNIPSPFAQKGNRNNNSLNKNSDKSNNTNNENTTNNPIKKPSLKNSIPPLLKGMNNKQNDNDNQSISSQVKGVIKEQLKQKIKMWIIANLPFLIPIIGIIIAIIFAIIVIFMLLSVFSSNSNNSSINNNAVYNCSSISLTTTSLSKDEFISKMKTLATSDSAHSSFYNNASTIYDTSVSNNFNPELVVIRAKAEGFSPGSSSNNYWGLGCTNGKNDCKQYSSFSEGLLAFIKNVSQYSDVQSMMSKYAYIGKYWYNGNYTNSGLGGCYYYNSIKDYLSVERSKTVSDACSSNGCSQSGGSACLSTTSEDQNAYSLWQVAKMSSIGSQIFGTIADDCKGTSGANGTSSSTDTQSDGKSCTIYAQGDSKWSSKRLGSSNATMASAGCAVTSLAIGISCSGVTINSTNFNAGILLDTLNNSGCIDSSGNLSWACSAISNIATGVHLNGNINLKGMSINEKIQVVQNNSKNNTFVILHISNAQHRTHFVVYSKTSGTNFVVKDPAGGKVTTYSANDVDSIRIYSY
jgi:hypothetical protein